MRFFRNLKIDFINRDKYTFVLSAALLLIGILSLIIHGGPKLSIDFTGGTLLELQLDKSISIDNMRDVLTQNGFGDAELQNVSVSKQGISAYIIRIKGAEQASERLLEAVKSAFPGKYDDESLIRRQETVGPKIGGELKGKAIMAIFYSLLGIVIYIWWRFEFKFGIAAIVALLHDVLITVGVFSLLGKEISLTVIAALLTIVGYSLNDTIVVFDRIREDSRLFYRDDYRHIINRSINETLSRTIITSLTTLAVVFCLLVLGGHVINDFAFALFFGVLIGTYSSIFIASPILVHWHEKAGKKIERKIG